MTCSEGKHVLVFEESSECGCVWVACLECSHGETHTMCDDCWDDDWRDENEA